MNTDEVFLKKKASLVAQAYVENSTRFKRYIAKVKCTYDTESVSPETFLSSCGVNNASIRATDVARIFPHLDELKNDSWSFDFEVSADNMPKFQGVGPVTDALQEIGKSLMVSLNQRINILRYLERLVNFSRLNEKSIADISLFQKAVEKINPLPAYLDINKIIHELENESSLKTTVHEAALILGKKADPKRPSPKPIAAPLPVPQAPAPAPRGRPPVKEPKPNRRKSVRSTPPVLRPRHGKDNGKDKGPTDQRPKAPKPTKKRSGNGESRR